VTRDPVGSAERRRAKAGVDVMMIHAFLEICSADKTIFKN